MGTQAFFEKYASQLLCVNGIDMATNNHDGGTRHIWSGKLEEGHPSFGALVGTSLPMRRLFALLEKIAREVQFQQTKDIDELETRVKVWNIAAIPA